MPARRRSGAPIRIVFPHGRSADAAYPVKVTAELLDRLEDYFGTPYPYPKLDMLAVLGLQRRRDGEPRASSRSARSCC